ncbi:MAG: hypothetical protein K8R48_08965 [Alphaproteobacteria bacterium]|nr:hypothetical protein [Alphaproteobacteria bacterium]
MAGTTQQRIHIEKNSVDDLRNRLKKQSRQRGNARRSQDMNEPRPELSPLVSRTVEALNNPYFLEKIAADPALKALHIQTLNHLRHISFDFRIENESYPHQPVLKGPYPDAPTLKALDKALEFFMVAQAAPNAVLSTVPKIGSEESLQQEQRLLVDAITKDPIGHYEAYQSRLEKYGREAPFPEFGAVIGLLLLKLLENREVIKLAQENPSIAAFRVLTLKRLLDVRRSKKNLPAYAYTKTIDAIERGVEFFDIVQRVLHPAQSPKLYHSHRYEYYLHYLTAQISDHVFFPTIAPLGVTDLLKVRGVPISFIGINTEIERVDGFHQTPYEFLIHDVNHSRRMLQFFREEAARRGDSMEDFCRRNSRYVRETLLPLFCIKKSDDAATRKKKKITKMVLFEILHEDALPADPAVIKAALLRPPLQLTPFEKIDGDSVAYIMEPGATTLAYVFRKLAHTFYDAPEDRRGYIVEDCFRSRDAILEAAKRLFSDLGAGQPPEDLLEYYVLTDAGFPDDFRQELEADIEKRKLEKLRAI